MANQSSPSPHAPGSILHMRTSYVPNSFEEKHAKNVRVCGSTGKSVDICYNTFGDPSNPMVLLISGLNSQGVVNYDSVTCHWLAAQGLYVVRMDNRDTGLSTKFDDVDQYINIFAMMVPAWMAWGEKQPYTLDDMADDAAALIRHLRKDEADPALRKAHVIGISMGGMITQCLALRHPELVATATLVMTHSGNHGVARPPLSTLVGYLFKPKSNSAEDLIAHRKWFVCNYLSGTPLTDFTTLDIMATEFRRSLYVVGIRRHMAAVQRAPCRDEALKALDAAKKIPIHIVHGMRDKLIPVGNAYHLSKLMPSAKLSIHPTMGHYMEPENVQTIYDGIVTFIRSIE